jgi:hypothetical protein
MDGLCEVGVVGVQVGGHCTVILYSFIRGLSIMDGLGCGVSGLRVACGFRVRKGRYGYGEC